MFDRGTETEFFPTRKHEICEYGSSELSVKNEIILGHVDIYVKRVHNSPISPYRRGEVSSPNGLGNPTPTEIASM